MVTVYLADGRLVEVPHGTRVDDGAVDNTAFGFTIYGEGEAVVARFSSAHVIGYVVPDLGADARAQAAADRARSAAADAIAATRSAQAEAAKTLAEKRRPERGLDSH